MSPDSCLVHPAMSSPTYPRIPPSSPTSPLLNNPRLMEAGQTICRTVRSVWSGFVDFALRVNVLEVAVGLIIASSFTSLVTSFVSDVLSPPISLLPFLLRNNEENFLVLRGGTNYHREHGYNTRNIAIEDGSIVLGYGQLYSLHRYRVPDWSYIPLSASMDKSLRTPSYDISPNAPSAERKSMKRPSYVLYALRSWTVGKMRKRVSCRPA